MAHSRKRTVAFVLVAAAIFGGITAYAVASDRPTGKEQWNLYGGTSSSVSEPEMEHTANLVAKYPSGKDQWKVYYKRSKQQLREVSASCRSYEASYGAYFVIGDGTAFEVTQRVQVCRNGGKIVSRDWSTPDFDQAWYSQWVKQSGSVAFYPDQNGYFSSSRVYRRVESQWKNCLVVQGSPICQTENPYQWIQVNGDGTWDNGGAH
jgi:hypothetical protein